MDDVTAEPNGADSVTLSLQPIGIVRSAPKSKVEAARQPRAAEGTAGLIELIPGRNFEHALDDLTGWEYIWVIFWFHLNKGWRPKVLPPRSVLGRKGVFSTRSPHRPNPIGLSAVRLERVDGLTLHIRDIDMVDGTPVLDIKPYVAYTDAHAAAGNGWLGDAGAPPDPVSPFDVSWSQLAAEQAAWIESRTGLALRDRVTSTLLLGATPHPYRRIRRVGDGGVLSAKDWRIEFSVADREIRVLSILSGYRPVELKSGGSAEPIRSHCEFVSRWGMQ